MPECPSCKTSYDSKDRYCNQCGTRLSQEQFMDSGARTQKALDLIDVHYNLGLVYFKKGQHRQALEIWEKALVRDPGNENLEERIAQVKALMAEDN